MTARARAAASPATTAAKARTAARARAAAQPTAPRCRSSSNQNRDRRLAFADFELIISTPESTSLMRSWICLIRSTAIRSSLIPEYDAQANRFNAFQDHGVGIGLRIPHYQHIFSRKPVVDWFEIISENFMIDAGRPLAMLDQILEHYRVVQHGVSMYFGSVTAPDPEHLRRLKQLVRRTEYSLAQRPPLLGQRGWHLHARPASAAVHMGGGGAHRGARAHGAGLP